MLLLMHPRLWLTFWAMSTHCQLMSSFSSTCTPKCFSAGLLSIPSFPSLYWHRRLPQPKCKTLALLDFIDSYWLTSEFVKAPLDVIPSLQFVNCTTQLGVICKFAEAALNLFIQITGNASINFKCIPIFWKRQIDLITTYYILNARVSRCLNTSRLQLELSLFILPTARLQTECTNSKCSSFIDSFLSFLGVS